MHGQRLPQERLDVARPYLHAGPAFRQALCSTTAWARMAIAADLGCTDGRILTSELLTVIIMRTKQMMHRCRASDAEP